jgi:NhaA family Na+:H+ antiporter
MHTVNSPNAAGLTHHARLPGQRPRHDRGSHGGRAGTAAAGRMPRLWQFATEYLLLLPAGALAAVVWVNTLPESYFATVAHLHFLVNDVGMVLFFGLMMKEVVEATAPGGVLHPWRRAAMPLVASAGMTIVPAAAAAVIVPFFGEPRVLAGWPVMFATDLAFGYFVARMLFGSHPVIPFFVLLGICANALGIGALAAAAGPPRWRIVLLLLLMAAALGTAWQLRRRKVRSMWPYLLVSGGLSWSALYFGGLEPAFALVPILPFLPHAARDPGFFVDAPPAAHDALSRFELWARHPAQVALLLFGLVAGGVPIKALDWGTLGLPITGLLLKPAGLMLGVALALALGLHLPHRVGWREVLVVGYIATVGFTVALFFAAAVVGPGPTLSAIKMGALASLAGAVPAVALAVALGTGRVERRP